MRILNLRQWAASTIIAMGLFLGVSQANAQSKDKKPAPAPSQSTSKPPTYRPSPAPSRPTPAPRPAPKPPVYRPAPTPAPKPPIYRPATPTRPAPTRQTIQQTVTGMQSNANVVDTSTRTARPIGASNPRAIDQLYDMTSGRGTTGRFDSYRNIGGSTINTPVPAGPVQRR